MGGWVGGWDFLPEGKGVLGPEFFQLSHHAVGDAWVEGKRWAGGWVVVE